MDWKFWRHKKDQTTDGIAPVSKLSGPKELPQAVGQHLVTNQKQDPDWIWSLRCVVRRHPENKHVFDFRVFSPNQAGSQGIRVADYTSLDHHADMILFEGWFDKLTNQVKLQKRAPSLAA